MLPNPLLFDVVVFDLDLQLRLFGLLAFVFACATYPVYIRDMISGVLTPPRSTWFMWFALDVVALGSRINEGVLDTLLLAFTLGTFVVALFTIRYGKKGWSNTESYCVVIVSLAIIVWFFSVPLYATICSLFGMSVATYPMFKRVIKGERESLLAWLLVLIATIMNLLDGQILTSLWIIVIVLSIIIPVFHHHKLKLIKI